MKYFKFLALAAASLMMTSAVFTSCSDGNEEETPPTEFKVAPTSHTFEATGGTTTLTVTGEWDNNATTTADWLTVETTSSTQVTVTAVANTAKDTRNATVKVGTVDVTINQKGVSSSITVNPTSLTFQAEGALSQTVTVTTSNISEWDATADASWITVTKGTGKITVSVEDNAEFVSRTGTITISSPDYQDVKISVTQANNMMPAPTFTKYSATGIPSAGLEKPGPESFGGKVTTYLNYEITTAEGTILTNIYELDNFSDYGLPLYIEYTADGRMRPFVELQVPIDDTYFMVTSSLVIQDNKFYYFNEEFASWNGETNVLDCTHTTEDSLDVLVGVLVYYMSDGSYDGLGSEFYANLVITFEE